MADMKRIGIIMHGVTGRMGMNQHLIRSILAIRDQGGLILSDGSRVMPDPIIVGRNADKIEALAKRFNISRWSADIDAALANPEDTVFFDAASTKLRPALLRKAIDAGKHVYCEKPISEGLEEAVDIARLRHQGGVKKRHRPRQARSAGLDQAEAAPRFRLFRQDPLRQGRVRLTGCSKGDWMPAQRPSWNYRVEDGGGIVLGHAVPLALRARQCHRPGQVGQLHHRHPHPGTLGRKGREVHGEPPTTPPMRLSSSRATSSPTSIPAGAPACVRDDLVTFQIDGTHGSAVAGLHKCYSQHRVKHPETCMEP